MGADASRAVVQRYFERMAAGDPAVTELLADDVSWWVPPSSPLAGLHEGREAVLALMGQGVALYDPATPMRFEVQRTIAEGEWVAVELVLRARTARGEDYANVYHFAFRVVDGRIREVREHVDTLYAQRMLFD